MLLVLLIYQLTLQIMMAIKPLVRSYLQKKTRAASLAAFRVLFGLLMLFCLVRFLAKGWVYDFYIAPKFHFKYYGFSWISSLGNYTYLLFGIAILASICIAIGFKYKLSIIVFFLSFTYIELIDKTTYLNHYYFISVLSFLLCFLPLHATFSVDAFQKQKSHAFVPAWTVDAIKLLLAIVYFYAGLAKLNSDWLLRAQPLKTWLSTKTNFPVIGSLFNDTWFHYTMSWGGAIYDLTIPFLLVYKKTRPFAFTLVIIFHAMTSALFNIGMFPLIMICATLIFFSDTTHEKWLKTIAKFFSTKKIALHVHEVFELKFKKLVFIAISIFFLIQLIFPFRYVLYPDELFWTEEGYRFSWRVMLMEKAGTATFYVKDGDDGREGSVINREFLNDHQEKQMAMQPDLILQFAHYLEDHFRSEGMKDPQVRAEVWVTLNGRAAELLIDPKVDLTTKEDTWTSKDWILPAKEY